MEVIYTDGRDKGFIELCKELDNYLNDTVGGESQKNYDQYNTLEDIHDVVLIMEDGQAVGCGSFKRYKEKTAEVKRVFVKSSYRCNGLGKKIITFVEERAKVKGYEKLILETGVKLKDAQRLYKKFGFYIRENFGEYKDMPQSVCMEKYIGSNELKEYISKLEIELLKPEVRKSADRIEELLSEDYVEFCSSGKIYRLKKGDTFYDPNIKYEVKNFNLVKLSDECVQITYKAKKQNKETKLEEYSNRSSIWRCFNGKWKMSFHQGTLTDEY